MPGHEGLTNDVALLVLMSLLDDDNDAVLFEKIKSGDYDADDPIWENISNEAKDVVAKLLTVSRMATAAGVEDI